jgi:hypothetical protein
MKIKGTKARVEHQNEKQYQILDLEAKKVYRVDPDKKQVMVMGLEMLNAAGVMLKQMSQNAQLNVQNTGNKRKVNGFNCTDYVVSVTGGVAVTSKQCITTDVDASDFEAFRPYVAGMIKSLVGDQSAAKIPPGMSVVSETNMSMMGQNITSKTELQSVTKEEIPAAVFEVPKDFEVKEMTGMPKQ